MTSESTHDLLGKWRAPALLLALLLAVPSQAPAAKGPDIGEQLKFGVAMAKRGLWAEAQFRFEQALQQAPGDPKILNNLAVSYEAVGRFEDALATYQKALQLAPGNQDLKRNYSQFLEFYQAFRPAEEEAEQESEDGAGGDGPEGS